MNVKRTHRLALVAVAAALLIGALWYQFGSHRTAPGQPPLARLDGGSLERLRTDFNAAADQPRVIVLLSPT